MLEAARCYKKAAVIGGGLLGLEAANALARRGMDVTVVHLFDTLMERQLDTAAAALLKASLESRGLKFKMPAKTPPSRCGACGRVALRRRERGRSGSRRHGDRRTSQHRAGEPGRTALRARDPGRRHVADIRSQHLRRGRVRTTSQQYFRIGRAAVGASPRLRDPFGGTRRLALSRHAAGHETQGCRHRVVFGPEISTALPARRRWSCRIIATASISAW